MDPHSATTPATALYASSPNLEPGLLTPALDSARLSFAAKHGGSGSDVFYDRAHASSNFPLKDVLQRHKHQGVSTFLHAQMHDTRDKLMFENALQLEQDRERLENAKEEIRIDKLMQIKKRKEAKL